MNKLKRLEERLWLWMNKKPSSRKGVYTSTVMPWIMVGFLLFLVLITIPVVPWGFPLILMPILLGAYVASYIFFLVRTDHKMGYIDALHRHYLERREKRIAEITARKAEEENE